MRRLCLILPLAAGCLDPIEEYLVVDERFEAPLAERWNVQGTVTQVPTIHSAEHGARFEAWTTLSLGLAVTIYDELSDGHWFEYSSSCGGAPVIWAQSTGDDGYQIWVDLAMEEDGTPDEFSRIHANLPPLGLSEDWNLPTTISALHVQSAASPCVIDNLRVFQPSPEYAY